MSWTVGGNTFPQNCYVVTVTLSFRKSTWYDLGNKLLRYRKNVFGLISGRIINILFVATIYIYMEEDISMCTIWYAHVLIYTYSGNLKEVSKLFHFYFNVCDYLRASSINVQCSLPKNPNPRSPPDWRLQTTAALTRQKATRKDNSSAAVYIHHQTDEGACHVRISIRTQLSLKQEYKPWNWDAIERSCVSHPWTNVANCRGHAAKKFPRVSSSTFRKIKLFSISLFCFFLIDEKCTCF